MAVQELFCCQAASCAETEAAGARLAALIPDRAVTFCALYGDLGAGKTAFVRGMASVLCPTAAVCSPTYAIVNEYSEDTTVLYHFDLYRLSGEADLESVGFYDYFTPDRAHPRCVLCAEWCERIPDALPPRYYRVEIAKTAQGREIRVSHVTKEAQP